MSRTLGLSPSADLAAARPYPERAEQEPAWHDRAAEFLQTRALRLVPRRLHRAGNALAGIIDLTDRHDTELRSLTDAALTARVRGIRARLRREGFSAGLTGEGFALVREAAARTLHQRHFPTQLMAGRALLDGRLVEMDTGEGKTFAATLPASLMALAGYPVHVITVNDYLAARDAEAMRPLYEFLGLEVGCVVEGMPTGERKAAYARSIAYCSNKELAFDYLRDRARLGRRGSPLHLALERLGGTPQADEQLVLRGLWFGLVDEADGVFIDEARTPLILSATAEAGDDQATCAGALALARTLAPGEDYLLDRQERRVVLTEAGRARLDAHLEHSGSPLSYRALEEQVSRAISALALYHRDRHYVVTEGKVQIVDESTGRVMPGRSWERGLHQMIEAKEGCELTAARRTLARITYQRLFRRYLRLAGMSGTAMEVAGEIRSVYRLNVVTVPRYKPLARERGADRLCTTRKEKWSRVADRVEALALGEGRPVLIGTRAVRDSEELSAVLDERGIGHALLNAKQDRAEAEIIAAAGMPGRVTVATNMAGRGTDIALGPGVAERGGLHVILTEFHESRRIDRQLFGRCARQGDPGSCEAIVSLEDEIFTVHAPVLTGFLRFAPARAALPLAWVLPALRGMAQRGAERRNAYLRVQNLKTDVRQDKLLAFSGKGE